MIDLSKQVADTLSANLELRSKLKAVESKLAGLRQTPQPGNSENISESMKSKLGK